MEKLGAKLEEFNQSVKDTIEALLEKKGVVSKFDNSRIVLVIQEEDAMFNLNGRRHLVEISEDCLIDNEGYTYGLGFIDLESLCIAIDSVIDGFTPNFRIVTFDEVCEEQYEYFERQVDAYTKFVKIQCKGEDVKLEERQSELDRHGMPEFKTKNKSLRE